MTGDPFMATGFGDLKVFSGTAHKELTREVAEFLGVQPGEARLRPFPDTEVSFQIDENIRGADVFIIQPTCRNESRSVNDHLVELLIMIDAFKRSSAARITAVLPYYGYARQDRKDKPRVPISAKLVANVLSAAGTNRVLTMDLHKAQIQGFFDIPVDHLFAAPVIIDYLSRLDYPKLTLVSPDAGGAERARAYAKRLDAELAVMDRRSNQYTRRLRCPRCSCRDEGLGIRKWKQHSKRRRGRHSEKMRRAGRGVKGGCRPCCTAAMATERRRLPSRPKHSSKSSTQN